MLPVVANDERTKFSIVAYSVVLLGVSLVPAIWLGPVYAVGSLLLGTLFALMAICGLSANVIGVGISALPFLADLPRPPLHRGGHGCRFDTLSGDLR